VRELCVNGRYTRRRTTGVERYAHAIVSRLGAGRVIVPDGAARGLAGHLWEQAVLPGRVGYGALFSPCNTGPLAVRRQVVTIHDLAALERPEGFAPSYARWYRWLLPRLARRAAAVVTVSEHSRGRLAEVCGLDAATIRVVPNAADARFAPQPPEAVARLRARRGLPADYVLVVGSLEPRKNLGRLLAAWERLAPRYPGLALVVAGAGDGTVFRGVGRRGAPAVRWLGHVGDDELPALYSGARCFVYPSLYEGFGLPVLEAMACGAPVVCADATSLPEVAGDAALLVDAREPEAIDAGLARVLDDAELAASLRARGVARAAGFSWDRSAAAIRAILAEVAEG
jgi:glycosyltransferase involved in cell wall biosynthesis